MSSSTPICRLNPVYNGVAALKDLAQLSEIHESSRPSGAKSYKSKEDHVVIPPQRRGGYLSSPKPKQNANDSHSHEAARDAIDLHPSVLMVHINHVGSSWIVIPANSIFTEASRSIYRLPGVLQPHGQPIPPQELDWPSALMKHKFS